MYLFQSGDRDGERNEIFTLTPCLTATVHVSVCVLNGWLTLHSTEKHIFLNNPTAISLSRNNVPVTETVTRVNKGLDSNIKYFC